MVGGGPPPFVVLCPFGVSGGVSCRLLLCLVCCSRWRWPVSSGVSGPGGVCGARSVRGRCCGVFGLCGGRLWCGGSVSGGVCVVAGSVGCWVGGFRFVGCRSVRCVVVVGRVGECRWGGWCSFVGGVCGSTGSCRRSGGSRPCLGEQQNPFGMRSAVSLKIYSRSLNEV